MSKSKSNTNKAADKVSVSAAMLSRYSPNITKAAEAEGLKREAFKACAKDVLALVLSSVKAHGDKAWSQGFRLYGTIVSHTVADKGTADAIRSGARYWAVKAAESKASTYRPAGFGKVETRKASKASTKAVKAAERTLKELDPMKLTTPTLLVTARGSVNALLIRVREAKGIVSKSDKEGLDAIVKAVQDIVRLVNASKVEKVETADVPQAETPKKKNTRKANKAA